MAADVDESPGRQDMPRAVVVLGQPEGIAVLTRRSLERVIQPKEGVGPLLLIAWNSEWMRRESRLWLQLYDHLSTISDTRILVLIHDDTPDDLGEEGQGGPAKVLLRALAADRPPQAVDQRPPVGWVSLSNVESFELEAVEWRRPAESSESAILRLCSVCAELSEWQSGADSSLPPVTLTQFFQFLSDPLKFRTSILHGASDPPAERRRLNTLKWLAAHVQIPRSLPLNILVVDNDKSEPMQSAQEAAERLKSLQIISHCPLRYLRHARVFVVSEQVQFQLLKSEQGRSEIRATRFTEGWSSGQSSMEGIPWSDIDLVLQDVMLGQTSRGITGLELASFYFDACPQALVFLLTGLDIESLVVSGDINWRFVDAVIPKDGLESLWFEYQRCFQQRFGRMFWPGWTHVGALQGWATGEEEGNRQLLRHLFGSLRKWQIEPDILWHGQTLPEMIDHANRHITALWRLVNDFVGTLIENGGADRSILDLRYRVALALAVWMHDVGHRGDQYVIDSITIRKIHGGISERLLLRNPGAYGLSWLLDDERIPYPNCRPREGAEDPTGRRERLECRNRTECRQEDDALCLLREVGLLCRHHQSNAPLDDRSVAHIIGKKTLSPYSFIPDDPDPNVEQGETFLGDVLEKRLTDNLRKGVRLRLLEEFKVTDRIGFRRVAGLLRMLDALQIHRSRVGSAASIDSFLEFLDNRDQWCGTEIEKRGTDFGGLSDYKLILNAQDRHYWRQAASDSIQVVWRWEEKGEAVIDISFTLNERALAILPLINSRRRPPILEPLKAGEELSHEDISKHPNKQEISHWIKDVQEDLILSEHLSQHREPGEGMLGYLGVLTHNVTFRVVVAGTDQMDFGVPYIMHSVRADAAFRAQPRAAEAV